MQIVFAGGQVAGCIGLLTVRALGHEVLCVLPSDKLFCDFARDMGFDLCDVPRGADLLVSVHSKIFFADHYLKQFKKGGINVHPCLWKYKGARPITRLLTDGGTKASVGVHRLTNVLDGGEVLAEIFMEIKGKTEIEVYNELYPLYAIALKRGLEVV